MSRKGNWFSSVKKALSPDTQEKKAKKANKSKKRWFGKEKLLVASESPNRETEIVEEVSHPHPLPPLEDVKLAEVENEEMKNSYDVAVASTAAAEVADAAAQAAAERAAVEVVRQTTVSQFAGKSNEEVAAIKIQTAFRGYLARRALRALRGLVRLKSLVDGSTVKRQTSNTLKCMQTLSRVQSQIQSRRLRMLEDNRALQRQLLQKRAKELESLRVGDEWDDSLQSKEKIESNLLHKYEAAMRREKALAYSYTHQQAWKKSSKPTNLLFMDPTNPNWGWSWLERFMAARPWETQATTADKDIINSSIKSPSGQIIKSFARHQFNSDNNPSSPPSQKPPSPFTPSKSVISKKVKPASPISQDDDSRSTFSVQSEIRSNRRHTIGGGSSVRDDESLGSSSSVPSYMATTRSARAKLSPLGMENGSGNNSNNNTPDKGSVKKRLSFPASPSRPPRRHSGPPKVEKAIA
ncbi:hypothetical protein CASFOL_042099 [Castilleja foliolosa]|uniref:DUF4005 domain-containing protein n=1 Tax=Castilleja foliolosa TaxID=1961234 RepID=A0ABD3B9I6_9LAMI